MEVLISDLWPVIGLNTDHRSLITGKRLHISKFLTLSANTQVPRSTLSVRHSAFITISIPKTQPTGCVLLPKCSRCICGKTELLSQLI